MTIPWMRELPSRCDHFNFVFDSGTLLPNFIFNTWEEQGYFSCSKCGKKFWESSEDHIYEMLYPEFVRILEENRMHNCNSCGLTEDCINKSEIIKWCATWKSKREVITICKLTN